jgi:hypothetical protein
VIVEFALPTAAEAEAEAEAVGTAVIFGVNVSGGLDFYVNFTGTNFTEVEIGTNAGHSHAAPGAEACFGLQSIHETDRLPRQTRDKHQKLKKTGLFVWHTGPPLRLTAEDRSITMRVFVDDEFVECYFMNGRRVITWGKSDKKSAAASSPDNGDGVAISAFASAPIELKSAVAWELSSIWVDVEDILKTTAAR